jgi:hypothetical protein
LRDPAGHIEFTDGKIFKEVSMGGRFGKYGDAKRKAQIRKNRLRPPDAQQRGKDKPLKGSRKSKVPQGVQTKER